MNPRSGLGVYASTPGTAFFEKTLLDEHRGLYVEDWFTSSEELMDDTGFKWRIAKHRLRGGLGDGVDIVEVDNGHLWFIVVPTRGMGLWKGRCGGNFLGWNSPVKGLVHPYHVNPEAKGGLGWLTGFNEWVVRCGLESNGAPGEDVVIDNMGNSKRVLLPLHGRVANIPASEVKVFVRLGKPMELGVTGVVSEQSMFGPNFRLTTALTTVVGSNQLRVSDAVENLEGVTAEMQLLYHCNYGMPFLEEGSRLIAPVKRLAPRDRRASEGIGVFNSFTAPEPGFVEQVYFFELIDDERGWTKVVLVNRDATKAVSVSFSLKQLPCFTLWKNTASLEDGYVVGLEPATNFPNHKAFERKQGRVVNLKPGGRYEAGVTLAVHIGEAEVREVEEEVGTLQQQVKPEVFSHPVPEFSPG